jgi:hypothetical protein
MSVAIEPSKSAVHTFTALIQPLLPSAYRNAYVTFQVVGPCV